MSQPGVVREFHAGEGWGVLDGPGVPGGCWVHFSAIAGPGFRSLAAGQAVTFRAVAPGQDGYPYRAEKVWTTAGEPDDQIADAPSDAYGSSLTLSFDDPG
jgi:CspA family cold shock protein